MDLQLVICCRNLESLLFAKYSSSLRVRLAPSVSLTHSAHVHFQKHYILKSLAFPSFFRWCCTSLKEPHAKCASFSPNDSLSALARHPTDAISSHSALGTPQSFTSRRPSETRLARLPVWALVVRARHTFDGPRSPVYSVWRNEKTLDSIHLYTVYAKRFSLKICLVSAKQAKHSSLRSLTLFVAASNLHKST